MFCIECGNKVETGFKFCPNCGTKVSQREKVGTHSSENMQKRVETQGREYMLQAYRGNFYDSERMYPISEYRGMFFYVSMINSNFYIVVYSPKKGTKHLFVKLQNQDLFSDNFTENQVYVNSFGIFIKCGKGNQFIHVDFDRKIQRVLPLKARINNNYYITDQFIYYSYEQEIHKFDIQTNIDELLLKSFKTKGGESIEYTGSIFFANNEYLMYYPIISGRVVPSIFSMKTKIVSPLPKFKGFEFRMMNMSDNTIWYNKFHEDQLKWRSNMDGFDTYALGPDFEYYRLESLESRKLVKEFDRDLSLNSKCGAVLHPKFTTYFDGNYRFVLDRLLLRDGTTKYNFSQLNDTQIWQPRPLGNYFLSLKSNSNKWYVHSQESMKLLGEINFKESEDLIFGNDEIVNLSSIIQRDDETLNFNDFKTSINNELEKFQIFSMNYKGFQANGYLTTKGFIVKKGSQINPEIVPSCPQGTIKARQQYADKINGNRLVVDIEFSSISAAASFVAGASQNGNVVWKNEEGVTFKELHK
ncbi:DUF4357 domain-containing protein [Streptococcus suis]|uniref:DUF4357 domain-containing protein n=1 Tax=Streptococcus suis TaxID=1307 RepID=UPI000CF4E63F|nr:DUF4357 domain-containing protein [Streptococcus suis]